jgi:hypothetical protein
LAWLRSEKRGRAKEEWSEQERKRVSFACVVSRAFAIEAAVSVWKNQLDLSLFSLARTAEVSYNSISA